MLDVHRRGTERESFTVPEQWRRFLRAVVRILCVAESCGTDLRRTFPAGTDVTCEREAQRFLGGNGGIAKKHSRYNLIVPSFNTARIQELHIFLGHFIFQELENLLIKN